MSEMIFIRICYHFFYFIDERNDIIYIQHQQEFSSFFSSSSFFFLSYFAFDTVIARNVMSESTATNFKGTGNTKIQTLVNLMDYHRDQRA